MGVGEWVQRGLNAMNGMDSEDPGTTMATKEGAMIDYKLVAKPWVRIAAWIMPVFGLAMFIHGSVDTLPTAQLERIAGIFIGCVGLVVAPAVGRVILEEQDGVAIFRVGIRTKRYDTKDLRDISETDAGFSLIGKNGVQLQFISKTFAMKRA